MIFYKLVAIVLSITTGDVVTEHEEPYKPMSLEKCIELQASKGVEHPVDGKVTVYACKQVEIV